MRRERALRRLAASAGTAVLAAATAADAAEYCVACAQPDATYRCIAPEVSAAARDTGTQLLCIQDIARRAGHKTCTIERKPQGTCEGAEWTVSGGLVTPAVVVPPRHQPGKPVETPMAATPAQQLSRGGNGDLRAAPVDAASGPPAGMRSNGAAGQTYYPTGGGPTAGSAADLPDTTRTGDAVTPAKPLGKAGEALESAGTAVGGAARKTWECVSSLFSKC